MHFCLNFTFLSILVISLLTGNDLSHSQPSMHYLISSNASHSINLFIAQWRLVLSESAVLPMLLLFLICHYHQTYCCHATSIAWNVLHVMSNVTGITGKLCNKCAKQQVI